MKQLCSILGVIGIISVVGSSMASSCYDAFKDAADTNKATQEEYQKELDYLEEINSQIDGVDQADIQKQIDELNKADIQKQFDELNKTDIQKKLDEDSINESIRSAQLTLPE